jgi:hypothetical protein
VSNFSEAIVPGSWPLPACTLRSSAYFPAIIIRFHRMSHTHSVLFPPDQSNASSCRHHCNTELPCWFATPPLGFGLSLKQSHVRQPATRRSLRILDVGWRWSGSSALAKLVLFPPPSPSTAHVLRSNGHHCPASRACWYRCLPHPQLVGMESIRSTDSITSHHTSQSSHPAPACLLSPSLPLQQS